MPTNEDHSFRSYGYRSGRGESCRWSIILDKNEIQKESQHGNRSYRSVKIFFNLLFKWESLRSEKFSCPTSFRPISSTTLMNGLDVGVISLKMITIRWKHDVTIDKEDEWHLAEACPGHAETHLLDQLDCLHFFSVKRESAKRVRRRRRQHRLSNRPLILPTNVAIL